MNAFEQLQASFANNLQTTPPAVQSPEPIDQRKVALAQNKQATLQQISQGPTQGVQ